MKVMDCGIHVEEYDFIDHKIFICDEISVGGGIDSFTAANHFHKQQNFDMWKNDSAVDITQEGGSAHFGKHAFYEL